MATKRPTSVLVLAIFHFIIGGLGVICGLCSIGSQAMGGKSLVGGNPQQAQMQEEMMRAYREKVPGFLAYSIITEGLTLALAISLIVAGIGLLQMKAWGRFLSIGYAIARIPIQILVAFYTFAYISPVNLEVMQNAMKGADAQAQQGLKIMQDLTGVLTGIVVAIPFIYPIIVLIIRLDLRLRLPSLLDLRETAMTTKRTQKIIGIPGIMNPS